MIPYCHNVKRQPNLIWRVLWWQKPTQNIEKSNIHLLLLLHQKACLLLLISHQSLNVLHFLPFKIKFLLMKLFFPGHSFPSRNQSYHLMIVAFLFFFGFSSSFPAFVWPKVSSEFKRSSSACEASSSSFCFFAAFSSFKVFSLSSDSSAMSPRTLSNSPSSSTSIPNARFPSLSFLLRDLIYHLSLSFYQEI